MAALCNSKQASLTVLAYYLKLKLLWDELSNYEQLPACTSGMKEELLKQKEEIKIHQFFLGLDDTTYSIVRSSILQIYPLPSIEKVYSMITTEEQHKKISKFAENRGEL